jgi:peptide/nickel transport system ATP-binding protein/oligopeptide transport system ATP-binding protein
MTAPLLELDKLSLEIDTFDGALKILDGVSFTLAAGETLGLVGETGCGKSVTAKAIMGLLPSPPARITAGDLRFEGHSLKNLSGKAWRRLRGSEIAMVFQDPMTFLNPLFSIGKQMEDAIMAQNPVRLPGQRLNREAARRRGIEMLGKVHLPDPERAFSAYPHALSGGQRQRVLVAIALAGSPKLLIADEPTTALDVTIQAQILALIDELVNEMQLAVLLISHDLGVVARVCQRIAVMYAGRIVEEAPLSNLLDAPLHPYTQGLIGAIPRLDKPEARLSRIPGSIPDLIDPPAGCRFHPRCSLAIDRCRSDRPGKRDLGAARYVACHRVESSDLAAGTAVNETNPLI